MIPTDRSLYLHLAHITTNKRLRRMYLRNYARVLRREWEKAPVLGGTLGPR